MKLTLSNLYCVILVIAGLSASCKKITDADIKETGTEVLNGIVGPVPPYTWQELDIPGQRINYPFNRPWSNDIIAPAGGTYFLWTGMENERVFRFNKTQLRWEAHPGWKVPGDLLIQHKVLFKYDSKVYYSFDNYFDTDFHVLDPIAGTNTNLAAFPDPDSIGYYPNTFVVGDNGYIFFDMNDGYWKYNFPTNTWTRLGQNPFRDRRKITIVVANGKAYAGLGYTVMSLNGSNYAHYRRDWVEFNPETGATVAKAQFPFYVSGSNESCVIGDNIYVGFGKTTLSGAPTVWNYNLYKYDISANRWSECTDWPGLQLTPSSVYDGWSQTNMTMFSLGSSVYVTSGGIYQFYRYSNSQIIVGTN